MASSWKSKDGAEQRQSIRDTVHLLLSLLSECGAPKLPSECFRQAKFNQQAAVNDLWKLLFHTMQIINFLYGDLCVDTITHHPIKSSNRRVAQTRVRHYLHELGYQHEEFYVPNVGSRELLLAFAWLLHRTDFFSKLTKHYRRFANMTTVPLKPTNQCLVEHVLEETRVMGYEFEKSIDSFQKAVSDPKTSFPVSVCTEALHKLVWLKGKLDSKWKAVQRLCIAYQRLSDNIHKSTYTMSKRQAGIKGHLSTHEVFLLHYPNQMKTHLAELGHRANVLRKLIEWRVCEPLFWQWMESVLDLQEEGGAQGSDEESEDIQIQTELESVETLLSKVHTLQEKFEDCMGRKKSQIDRVEQVWRQKSGMHPHKDINRKLQSIKAQLQHEYPITTVSTNQTVLAASIVQQAIAIDTPVYAPVQTVAKQSHRLSYTSFQTLQQEADAKLVLTLREHLNSVARKIEVLECEVEEGRARIRMSLEALERKLPSSLYKIV